MKKIGILGGGQLGRMLLQAAANYPAETYVMEKEADCPAANLCHHFRAGNIQDYDDVLAFGRSLDVITIEIEHVNVDALEQLEREGIRVIPKPAALRILQNKILQKEFYQKHQINSAPFVITQTRAELSDHLPFLPAVHKLAMGGYDGRGVCVLNQATDLECGFDEPSVLEKKIDIQKEIAVLVGVNQQGETRVYPAVEMVFDQKLNLLDYQLSPAFISDKTKEEAQALAALAVKQLESPGLFAVEMFLGKDGVMRVNEIAPRVHNSGHHTIEAHYSSQFDMLWRILMELPLGDPAALLPSIMVNLVGAEGYTGEATYEGLDRLLQLPNVFVHLYGKKLTKPGRKMGHFTMIGADPKKLIEDAHLAKSFLQIRS